ncbi:MAG TPA: nitroreductase family protein [Candidatus Dormibacteraeota bacterium]|jgi:nitroreductase|nr:nitroreductase family protein [Candidatus Dormibacteraeota bacterium]
MSHLLDAILQRRAVKVFDPIPIPQEIRTQILDAARFAPSSFNIQPYKLIWIESPEARKQAARLCMSQSPAQTASALVVAVADLGSWRSTAYGQLEWMRSAGFSSEKISYHEKRAGLAKWFFLQGWFGIFGFLKWLIVRAVNSWKIIGSPPVARQGMFKWATKSTALACENLMVAAETLGLNTCPMEGFDGRRLSKFLGLNSRKHEIVMVIAIGKKSPRHNDSPQWRRPLESTVTFL